MCVRIAVGLIMLFLLPHSLKLECEKLASEKTEMQRHYVMVSFIDYLCMCVCVHVCMKVCIVYLVCAKRGTERTRLPDLTLICVFF